MTEKEIWICEQVSGEFYKNKWKLMEFIWTVDNTYTATVLGHFNEIGYIQFDSIKITVEPRDFKIKSKPVKGCKKVAHFRNSDVKAVLQKAVNSWNKMFLEAYKQIFEGTVDDEFFMHIPKREGGYKNCWILSS